LALILGQTFQFNPLELQELATAALLHDIGLLQIDPSLVRQAHTDRRLSPSQQLEFETHPRVGARTLQQTDGIETSILHLIADHHAYLDNSGYPKETRGEFTSDRTRILMIVDRYDELLSGFGGATPMPSHRTFQQLYQEARQNKLDPKLLSAFIGLVGIYPVHSQVRLNTKERGVVTTLNQETLHQPIVTITHQAEGTTYPDPFTVNLADQPSGPQTRAIEAVITT
jgi:HD-GYP domain-containing protein (c-di-GMP phosphodiesterase class II)